MILSSRSQDGAPEEDVKLTSTFQPLFFIDVHNSLDVFTLLASTAVQVGKIAPSPVTSATSLT